MAEFPERGSSNVREGRDWVREEDNREEAVTEGVEENAEPSAEDCCWELMLLMLLFNPFRCIKSIRRLTSFSENCWPELV